MSTSGFPVSIERWAWSAFAPASRDCDIHLRDIARRPDSVLQFNTLHIF
jgi:hypothetical protein